jgi:O-succinylbenzoic acid--CoA ligase
LAENPFLDGGLAAAPEGVAVEDLEERWTYRELRRRAETFGGFLVRRGGGAGSRVALPASLDRHTVAALYGIWLVGAEAVPLHETWTGAERARALDLLRPGMILSKADVESVSTLGGGSEWGVAGGRALSGPSWGSRPLAHLLTSGTSGSPRVVTLTVGNLLASAEASRERLGLQPSDRWLGSLSPAHVGGLALLTRGALLGSAVVLRGSFRTPPFLELVRTGQVTHASLVPTMLHRLLDSWGEERIPSTLRCLLVGGAPTDPELLRRALEVGFPVALTYGLTEAASQVATAPPELVRKKPGTVGAPLPGVEVELAPEGEFLVRGPRLAPDGEILVRGPTVTPEGELLVRGPTVAPGQVEEDGWLHTGDLARRDGDGHLWITGRLSDRIISGGVTVDPGEVEAVLGAHPDVVEVAVVGIPDPEWGERVAAAVVAGPVASSLWEALQEEAGARLSPAKRPRVFREMEALPRNRNGKVDRGRLRELLQDFPQGS